MEKLPRRVPPADETPQQQDSPSGFQAGTDGSVYRRITVTFDRETLAVLTRQVVSGPTVPEQPDDNLPQKSTAVPLTHTSFHNQAKEEKS